MPKPFVAHPISFFVEGRICQGTLNHPLWIHNSNTFHKIAYAKDTFLEKRVILYGFYLLSPIVLARVQKCPTFVPNLKTFPSNLQTLNQDFVSVQISTFSIWCLGETLIWSFLLKYIYHLLGFMSTKEICPFIWLLRIEYWKITH